MLKLKGASLRRGNKLLFSSTDLVVHQGQRVGVTGANGAGKSSLFGLFLGAMEVDEGEVEIASGLVFASTDQEIEATDRLARAYVIDGDKPLRKLESELALAESGSDGSRHASLLTEYEQLGGYSADARAASLLSGLGFSNDDQLRPLSDFSGGWRMRLNLARALMCPSDVLLLDEPTNHLDLDAVLWLESWLRHYQGTLLLISHDREFLDRVCTHIAHIERESIRLYTGNYSEFEKQRAEQLAGQQAAYQRQQREIAHMQDFVRRFKAKATKARQAQSRIKALERMELISPAHVDSQFRFGFREPEHLPSPLLTLEDVNCGYGTDVIVGKVSIAIQSGEKIGLLGMNGAGKSTFVQTLVNELPKLAGDINASPHLKAGYFAQHQLEQLPENGSPLSYLQILAPEATEAELRDFAGGFGFHGDEVFNLIETLSGGEKARLVLAGIVWAKPNFLLLDEPTNHLDLEMRHALTVALQGFEGALLIVSHDRHLLRCCTDQLWLVADGGLKPFDSDLDAYTTWLTEQRRLNNTSAEKLLPDERQAEHSAIGRRERKRQEAEERRRIQPLKRAVESAETALEVISEQLSDVENNLADPKIYEENAKESLKTLLQEQANLKKQHDQLESDWMAAMEALELATQG